MYLLFLFPVFVMVFFGLMLPSDGNHGFLNPKSLSFLAAGGCWGLFVLAQQRYEQRHIAILAFIFAAVAFLFGSMLVGMSYGVTPFSSQFDQFKIFIITLAVVSIIIYLVESSAVSAQSIIRCALYANLFYSSLKVLGGVLHFTGIVNILTFMKEIGIRFMSMDIHAGVIRLQTSVDIVTPYLILFLLQDKALGLNFSKKFKVAYIFISIISVILSFSRYLLAITVIALALAWVTKRFGKQLISGLMAIAILFGVVAIVGPENVYKVIERRFFSSDNEHSDQTRVVQVEAMNKEIICSPLLGKGIGGYAEDCIRDNQLPYSYEVQWVAFVMQLGIAGTALLLLAYAAVGWRYFFPPYSLPKMSFAAMYVLWLLSGFTNPFLISLTSGIMYSLFAIAPRCLDQRYTQVQHHLKLHPLANI